MLYLIAISSVAAVIAGCVAARLFAVKIKAEALKGALVYAAFAGATIIALQLVPAVFGNRNENSTADFLIIDLFAFAACLFLICFSFFGLKLKK